MCCVEDLYTTDINPLGKVPAIVDGRLKLFESHAILIYLASAFPSVADHWYPNDLSKRAKIHSVWIGIIPIYAVVQEAIDIVYLDGMGRSYKLLKHIRRTRKQRFLVWLWLRLVTYKRPFVVSTARLLPISRAFGTGGWNGRLDLAIETGG